jgi:hypothetical protein
MDRLIDSFIFIFCIFFAIVMLFIYYQIFKYCYYKIIILFNKFIEIMKKEVNNNK